MILLQVLLGSALLACSMHRSAANEKAETSLVARYADIASENSKKVGMDATSCEDWGEYVVQPEGGSFQTAPDFEVTCANMALTRGCDHPIHGEHIRAVCAKSCNVSSKCLRRD